ncbi:phosphatidylserine decarboxylase 1 [Borealophlyctis nickersoniae]|nr:phosphatidylserine decarboxylase 1 [Borealophlyctis nickersoniae]
MRERDQLEESGKHKQRVVVDGPWQVRFYATLPLRSLSRLWGWANSLTVPVWLREPLYKAYSNAFGCNLEEMENPDLKSYRNLADFFYRSLKPGVRIIDPDAPLVSPADGKVLNFGIITERKVEQIKGFTYSLDALLGMMGVEKKEDTPKLKRTPSEAALLETARQTHSGTVVSEHKFADINAIDYSLDKILGDEPKEGEDGTKGKGLEYKNEHGGHKLKPGNALFFCVIYLAPGDYHRFHSPTDWVVEKRRHCAGELFSVSPAAVGLIKNLFVLNERVVLLGDWANGFFSMIPVGATNVGSIKIDFDPTLRTNLAKRHSPPPGTCDERVYPGGVKLKKGDLTGGFQLGSTVVLVFEAPKSFEFTLEAGQKLKVGEGIGRFKR